MWASHGMIPDFRARQPRDGPMQCGNQPAEESRPREFHPEPLAEPYRTLSCHTAPIVLTAAAPELSQ
jgi:hypothetical protein